MSTTSTSLICDKFGGIHKQSSSFSATQVTASDLQNIELYDTGINSGIGIRTSKGNTLICDLIPIGETVINIFESVQTTDTYFFVHTESDTEGKIYLYEVDADLLTLKVDSLTITGESSGVDFAQGWSDLFVFSNGEELLSIELGKYDDDGVLDEVYMMILEDRDERDIKGLGLVNFNGRLWIYSKNILWYSVQENIYDFSTADASIVTSSGYIEFAKDITAITTYLSSVAVFHNNSSCLVQIDDEQYYYVSDECPGGCASANAFVFHGTDLYFYDDNQKGVFSFTQAVSGNTTLGTNIASDMQDEFMSMNPDLTKLKMLSVILEDRNEFWFLLGSNDTNYSTILIYDYNHGEWIKRVCPRINCINVINNALYSGDDNGKIYQEYVGNDFHGEFVECYYKTSPLNFGVDNVQKYLYNPPKISLDLEYSNDFHVEYIKNYNSLLNRKTRNIVAKTLSNALYWDTGYYDTTYYASKNANAYYKLPTETFKTLEITFYTKTAEQDFCIRNLEFIDIKLKPMY